MARAMLPTPSESIGEGGLDGDGIVTDATQDAAPQRSSFSEFVAGWPTVVAAAAGMGLGVSGLLTYNSGLFLESLNRDISLSKTTFGAAFLVCTLMLAAALPIVGKMVDRYGSRAPAAIGAVALSLGFLGLATLTTSVATYFVIMMAIGFFAAASSPTAYTRSVSGAFSRARGLALGLAQVGIGISAALVPPLVTWLIANQGWKSGYLALAGLAALGLLPALLGLKGRNSVSDQAGVSSQFASVWRSRTFLVQLAAFSMMAFAFAGMLAHFVPMLREMGLTLQRAGLLAGLIGISVILSRILVGWLADHTEGSWVAAGACLLCAGGSCALAIGGPALAPLGAVALGCAMGAEGDLVGFLTARYYGLAVYGRAYALQYSGFMISAGISPLWVGMVADATGSYRPALLICAGLLITTSILFLMLPRTRE